MNEEVSRYIGQYPEKIRQLFNRLRLLVVSTNADLIEEKMWAKLPSYFNGDKFVRLIPFRDHINIEAKAAASYKDELAGYKMTPKNMVQIYENQEIPENILADIFKETLM